LDGLVEDCQDRGQLRAGLGHRAHNITSSAATVVLLAAVASGANASMKVMGRFRHWPHLLTYGLVCPIRYRFPDLS
jgi:hypothetical protein